MFYQWQACFYFREQTRGGLRTTPFLDGLPFAFADGEGSDDFSQEAALGGFELAAGAALIKTDFLKLSDRNRRTVEAWSNQLIF
jgi:hypothetical protein